jgi:hypothetical protein
VIDSSAVALQTVPGWGKAVTVELNEKPLQASTVITSVTFLNCPTVSDIGAPSRFLPYWPITAVTYSLGMACTFAAAYEKVKGTSVQVERLIRLQNDSGRKRCSSSQSNVHVSTTSYKGKKYLDFLRNHAATEMEVT